MKSLTSKVQNLARRKHRIRATVSGTTERPRLNVFISNKHVTAQIIDDTKHVTLTYVTTAVKESPSGTMMEKSTWVGDEIAKRAKKLKIKQVVFDRNGRLYHGRVKALAEAARAGGLEF